MTVVQETLDLPGGGAPARVTAVIQLAGEDGAPYTAGYCATPDATVVGTQRVDVDPATGAWSVDLPGNDIITPAGTVWRVVLSGAGSGIAADPRFIFVPSSGGPFELEDLLTDPPGTIPSTALATEIAAREAADAVEAAARETADAAETAAREAADAGLAAALADEVAARQALAAAVSADVSTIDAALTALSTALTALQARVTALEALEPLLIE